jgi:hypothetical protein
MDAGANRCYSAHVPIYSEIEENLSRWIQTQRTKSERKASAGVWQFRNFIGWLFNHRSTRLILFAGSLAMSADQSRDIFHYPALRTSVRIAEI